MEAVKEPAASSGGKLTVKDVALRENVSERTILNWIERGVLTPVYKVGKVIRFTAEGVERDLAEASKDNA